MKRAFVQNVGYWFVSVSVKEKITLINIRWNFPLDANESRMYRCDFTFNLNKMTRIF